MKRKLYSIQFRKPPPHSPFPRLKRKQLRKMIRNKIRLLLPPKPKKHRRLHRFCTRHILRMYMAPLKRTNGYQLWHAWTHLHQAPLPSSLVQWDCIIHEPVQYLRSIRKKKRIRVQEQYSDAYECPQCGQRNVQYTQLQTRSADEGMTSFMLCMECNHRWKEN